MFGFAKQFSPRIAIVCTMLVLSIIPCSGACNLLANEIGTSSSKGDISEVPVSCHSRMEDDHSSKNDKDSSVCIQDKLDVVPIDFLEISLKEGNVKNQNLPLLWLHIKLGNEPFSTLSQRRVVYFPAGFAESSPPLYRKFESILE